MPATRAARGASAAARTPAPFCKVKAVKHLGVVMASRRRDFAVALRFRIFSNRDTLVATAATAATAAAARPTADRGQWLSDVQSSFVGSPGERLFWVPLRARAARDEFDVSTFVVETF